MPRATRRPRSIARRAVRRAALAVTAGLILTYGCVHRAPVWSPDGEHLLVLAGGPEEDIQRAASRLFLVEAASGETRELPPPADGLRFLSATWIDDDEFVVATAELEEDELQGDTGALWRRSLSEAEWRRLDAPRPGALRSTRRIPFVVTAAGGPALVYGAGQEDTVVLSLETGEVVRELETAQPVGPGPGGMVLLARESEEGVLGIEARGPDLAPRWSLSFPELREALADELGTAPVDLVFNETATASSLPGPDGTPRIGLDLWFSDVSWREGFVAFHVRLDAKTGEVVAAARGKTLSGRAGGPEGLALGVSAPDAGADLPVTLHALDLEEGEESVVRSFPELERDDVHGWSVGPGAGAVAINLRGSPPRLLLVPADGGEPREVELGDAREP